MTNNLNAIRQIESRNTIGYLEQYNQIINMEYNFLYNYVRDIYSGEEYYTENPLDNLLWIMAVAEYYDDIMCDIREIFTVGEQFNFTKLQYIKAVKNYMKNKFGEDKLLLKDAVHITELYYRKAI